MQFACSNHAAIAAVGVNHHRIVRAVLLCQFKKRGTGRTIKDDHAGKLRNLAHRHLAQLHQIRDDTLAHAERSQSSRVHAEWMHGATRKCGDHRGKQHRKDHRLLVAQFIDKHRAGKRCVCGGGHHAAHAGKH